MIIECPACYSKKIEQDRKSFYRLLYYIEDAFSNFKKMFGYKCLSCGYNINEKHEELTFANTKK